MKHKLICCVSSGVSAHIYTVFIKYSPPNIQRNNSSKAFSPARSELFTF